MRMRGREAQPVSLAPAGIGTFLRHGRDAARLDAPEELNVAAKRQAEGAFPLHGQLLPQPDG
jgi:hypothetical protein